MTENLSITLEQIFTIVFCANTSQVILVLTKIIAFELISKLKRKSLENMTYLSWSKKKKGM